MADYYYGDYYGGYDEPTDTSSTLSSTTTTTAATTTGPVYNDSQVTNQPGDTSSILSTKILETAFSSSTRYLEPTPNDPFGDGALSPEPYPETTSKIAPRPYDNAHPFGEGIPEGGPEVVGEGFQVFPEGEAEPELRPLPVRWIDGVCRLEMNPWAEPEPEPEGAYAEPPAPLLQPSNVRDRGTYTTLAAVVATLIIVLNIAVLVALSKKPKQRKTLTYLIGLIAVFDLLGGLQFLWFSSFDVQLMFTHANMWIIVMCGIWMLTMAPQISSLLHFGLHLLDELHVGVNNAKVSSGRIIFVILTVFVIPIALFIPPLAGWNCIGCTNPADDPNYCAMKCSMPIFPFTKIYVLLMTVIFFAAILFVVSIYVTIYWTICQKKCQRRLSPKSGKADVIRVTTLLLAVYIICVLPVAIVMVFDYVTWKCNPHLINAFHATMFVSFLSNLVNPIIVFSTLPSMRNVFSSPAEGNGQKRLTPRSSASSSHGGENKAYNLDEKPPMDEENAAEVVDDDQAVTKI